MNKNINIFVPCCDASLHVIKINSYLFNKFWPEAKVHYLGFKEPEYDFYNENHLFHSLASEQVGGAKSWTRYIHGFMKNIEDEFVIFSLDDFLLCTEPNIDMIETALELMKRNYKVGRFDLTFDSQVETGCVSVGKLNNYEIIQKHPRGSYRISTQPSIWNRKFLLKFLDNDWTPWDFEIRGTQKASQEKMSQHTLAYRDEHLINFPLRTTAKGAISRFNPNKYNMLGMPIKTIKELVSEDFFKEQDIIWGQHANSPPGFYEKEGYNFHPSFLEYHETSKTGFEEYYCIYDDPGTPILTINLWDNNFSHTLDHPDFGYVTSESERTIRGKKLRYVLNKEIFNEYSGITIFTDHYMTSKIIKSVDSPIKIGWIMEMPVVHPWAYENLPKVVDNLDYVFSYSKELADKYDKCHVLPYCHVRLHPDVWGIHNKSKFCSLVASDKKYAAGHLIRHEIADKLSNKYNIELWGSGYKAFSGNAREKVKALKDYMFNIAVENSQLDTAFGNLIDPFIMGTVPLYWGTKESVKYFDEDGIIFFDTIEELEKILSSLTEKDYYKRLPSIKNNFELAKKYWRSDDQLAEMIYKVVDIKILNPDFKRVK